MKFSMWILIGILIPLGLSRNVSTGLFRVSCAANAIRGPKGNRTWDRANLRQLRKLVEA